MYTPTISFSIASRTSFAKVVHLRQGSRRIAAAHLFAADLEERHLAGDVFLGVILCRLYQTFVNSQVRRPVGIQTVEGAGLNQTLHRFLV